MSSKSMPLQNAGNITLHCELELSGGSQKNFSVAPTKLAIKPGEQKEIEIVFKSNIAINVDRYGKFFMCYYL